MRYKLAVFDMDGTILNTLEDLADSTNYALKANGQKYVEKFAKQYSFEYAFTSDYPSMDNIGLAKGYDAISIITNPMYPEILDALHNEGIKYISTRSIGYEHIDIKYAHSIGMRAAHVVYSPNSVGN